MFDSQWRFGESMDLMCRLVMQREVVSINWLESKTDDEEAYWGNRLARLEHLLAECAKRVSRRYLGLYGDAGI